MPDHTHGPDCIGIELRGVYDGVSVWRCPDGWRNAWQDAYDDARQSPTPDIHRVVVARWEAAQRFILAEQFAQEVAQETPQDALSRDQAQARTLGSPESEGFQVNTHGELVCTFTDLPDYSCSHCAGLPWEVEPDGDLQ